MTHDDHSPIAGAPIRIGAEDVHSATPDDASYPEQDGRVNEPHENAPAPSVEPATNDWQDSQLAPQPPLFPVTPLPDDLQVSWGWREIALFVILGFVGTVVITWGMGEAAAKIFGIPRADLFGDTMSTAKSVLVLISQALLDGGAILYLYLMILARPPHNANTPVSFWRSIGWREMRADTGTTIRHSAVQFLAGGAVLALAVTFLGSFMSSKETLPIEELLKARVSMFLFAILGVLVAPLVEETVFRGFLYPVLARRLGVSAGIAITGVLFGLMHAAQLWGGWGQIALLIFVGISLTWVRARTGTVAASYFVHLGYNGLQLVGYLIYVIGGLRH